MQCQRVYQRSTKGDNAGVSRGLATARRARDMGQVVEARHGAPRQLRHVRPDGGPRHDSWEPRACPGRAVTAAVTGQKGT
jgi:hypothetical protein